MKTKSLKYRFLWTWDHSMDWVPLGNGIQESGCFNPYTKMPDDFVPDYRNLIDFSATHDFTGIIIYGFLRDCHGGIESAKEICRYGREKGVRIIPGIGVNAYGGVYWEGKHEFNLYHWLQKHPNLAAVGQQFPGHPYMCLACPSKKENQQWMQDAVRWLSETFDIGGINFETGDYGLCQCEQCQRRNRSKGIWSFKDMAEVLPPLIEEAEKIRPGLFPICECYFNRILEPDIYKPLQVLPENTILQFCIDHSYLPKFLEEMNVKKVSRLPAHRKVVRTHMGSQWNVERHKLVARDFSNLIKKIAEVGMDGITIFGESSSLITVNEINYLSVSNWANEPEMTWDQFLSRELVPLLGGKRFAQKYVELLKKEEITLEDIACAKAILHRISEPYYRRWLWLVNQLYLKLAG